jgi:hypothetical protein
MSGSSMLGGIIEQLLFRSTVRYIIAIHPNVTTPDLQLLFPSLFFLFIVLPPFA